MKMHPRILECALVILAVLSTHSVSLGQSLYDVVISLSDRQRVVSQQSQVAAYLHNQNDDPADPDWQIPADFPIDWQGIGIDPSQSAVDGLDIGGKITLLNQAAAEFERLKFAFLNASPGEFNTGSVAGVLKPYTSVDCDSLPRAAPGNYHEVLRLLGQRVRTLRIIRWPSAFMRRSFTDQTDVREEVAYNDPEDSNNDDDYEPYVKLLPEGTDPSSVVWKPGSIGPGNTDVLITDPTTDVSHYFNSQVQVSGSYQETPSLNDEITNPLRAQILELSGDYPEEARVSATAPGGAGTPIDGTVYILRRSHWHQIDIDGASSKYEETEAGYVVEGTGSSGVVPLFSSPPSAQVNGSWVTWQEFSDEWGDYSYQKFVEGGYQHKEASILPAADPGHSDTYNIAYEKNWRIGCAFYSVFKPTFIRGVDATGMRPKLEKADGILADSSADGELMLHPRPGVLFGIRLGPGLKGAGNGYISGALIDRKGDDFFVWSVADWNPMVRFDSTYALHFAGSCSDYHVVYENDRSARSQSLPDLGWPVVPSYGYTSYDTSTLYKAWDSPRLKQVAGRDLVADVVYDTGHYGGYTIKIYRRPTGGTTQPTPGQPLSTSGINLIRTWTFSHPGGGATAHPTDAEKLQATGSGGEKYEIQANHVLPNQGLGRVDWYYYPYAWWWWTEGLSSWTLKLSQNDTEKLRKEIEIDTTKDGASLIWDIFQSVYLDGQPTSSLWSISLDPFTDDFPEDWEITSAGKTITGSATLGDYDDPATRYGKLPVSMSIDYDGIQPDAQYTWDANGLLSKAEQLPWYTGGKLEGGAYRQTHRINGATGPIFATDWTAFLAGGSRVRTWSAPDGSAGDIWHASVAWSEVEYGTAANGLPGLPFIVRNSDGSGATYGWNASVNGSYILTLEEGLLVGNSVTRGTKIIHSVNTRGHPTQTESFVINGGTVKTGGRVFADFTAWGMPRNSTDYNTNLVSTWDYSAKLSRLSTHTGYLGVAADFSGYDVLGRPRSVTINGITATNTFTAFSTSSTITGGATGSIAKNRDAIGRLTNASTTWNGVTDTANLDRSTAGLLKITGSHTLFGAHRDDFREDDGSVSLSTGDVRPFGGADGTIITGEDGLLKTTATLLDTDGDPTDTFTTTWTDAWGRVRKVSNPPASGSNPVYTGIAYEPLDHSASNSEPQRVIVTDKTGRVTITETDPISSSGILRRSGLDVNGNGSLGASDRFVESLTSVSGTDVVTILSLTEDGGLREILRTVWTPSNNWTVTTINGEETITRKPDYEHKSVETKSSKGWTKNESFNALGLTETSNLSGTGIPTADLNPTWRDDGSLAGVSLEIGGATHSATFNTNGTLATLTAPGRGDILGEHSISNGKETLTIDDKKTERSLDGTEISTSGGNTIGKTEALTLSEGVFKYTTTPAVGASTEVTLNPAGAPTGKLYADASGESYAHTPGGLLESVILARGGSLEFGYSDDGAKDLTTAVWPEMTSGVFTCASVAHGYSHDRAGRVDGIGDAAGGRGLVYQNGRLQQTTWDSGALAGYSVDKTLDEYGRDGGFTLYRDGTVIHSVQKVPNDVSDQVLALASGTLKVIPQRDAAGNITGFQWGNATGTFVPAVTQSWTRGTGGRIEAANSNVTGAPGFVYLIDGQPDSYSFDLQGRRLKCATAGGEWTYQYTGGQLTSAVHTATTSLGSFSYQFDGIGRRTDKGTANTTDLLNRTRAWTHSQDKTLKVTADPAAHVQINGNDVENFDGDVSYAVTSPGTGGGWVEWNALAVLAGEGEGAGVSPINPHASPDAKAEQTGAVWVPPVSETFEFDAAGNRQSSALWDYGWDGRNKLVRARTKNHDASARGYDITFGYDAEGRRFKKNVKVYQNGVLVSQDHITFIWDGWDLIYELHQNPSGLTTLERKYVWGPDIAGGTGGDTGAGGAGGLLLIRETRGTQTKDYYPLYDGSGHVAGLTTIIDNVATLQAEYAYGPFGELIHARGPMAQINPIRYATKYYDSETGLYYYGARYLDPITGQWLSREPLGESESINLYAYCHNDPVNRVDVLGLFESQGEVDNLRTDLLLGQLFRDPTKLPLAPPQEALDIPAIKYSPNADKFGMFKPYGQKDYQLAMLFVQMAGQPSMRAVSWEEGRAAETAAFSAPHEWIPSTTSALTLGGPNTPLMAEINAGFLLPSGAGAMGLKLFLGEARAFLPMLSTGAKVEAEILATAKGGTWGAGGSGYTLKPFDLGRKGTIFARAEEAGIAVDRSLAAGQSGGLAGGVPTIRVQPFSTSTVAIEEYLHARFAQRLVSRKGVEGAQRMMADPAFMLKQELRLKSKMIGAGERGFFGASPMDLNIDWLGKTRAEYQALSP